jgi:hypothetical protein
VREQQRHGAELENKGQDLACVTEVSPIPRYLECALQRCHVLVSCILSITGAAIRVKARPAIMRVAIRPWQELLTGKHSVEVKAYRPPIR